MSFNWQNDAMHLGRVHTGMGGMVDGTSKSHFSTMSLASAQLTSLKAFESQVILVLVGAPKNPLTL